MQRNVNPYEACSGRACPYQVSPTPDLWWNRKLFHHKSGASFPQPHPRAGQAPPLLAWDQCRSPVLRSPTRNSSLETTSLDRPLLGCYGSFYSERMRERGCDMVAVVIKTLPYPE